MKKYPIETIALFYGQTVKCEWLDIYAVNWEEKMIKIDHNFLRAVEQRSIRNIDLTGLEPPSRKILIDFMESLRDYVHDSENNIAFDERDSSEFIDIFLKGLEPNKFKEYE